MDISSKPVGIVHVQRTDEAVRTKSDVEGELQIYPEFAQGLEVVDGYSHLFVLVYFHRLRPEQIGPLKVKPGESEMKRNLFAVLGAILLVLAAGDSFAQRGPGASRMMWRGSG